MAKVTLSREVIQQIAAIREYYENIGPEVAERAKTAIAVKLKQLQRHPASGRPVAEAHGLREIVIPFGATGYVALYRVDEGKDVVVLAIRHQRQAGYETDVDTA